MSSNVSFGMVMPPEIASVAVALGDPLATDLAMTGSEGLAMTGGEGLAMTGSKGLAMTESEGLTMTHERRCACFSRRLQTSLRGALGDVAISGSGAKPDRWSRQ